MNIILTSYYYKPHYGGVENSLYHLAKEYIDSGNTVSIVCSDTGKNKKIRLKAYEELDGIPVYRFNAYIPVLPLFHIFTPFLDVLNCYRFIKNQFKNNKNDYIITRHYITGLAFYLCGFKKIVYLIPGVVSYQDKLPLKYLKVAKKTALVNLFYRIFILPQNEYFQKTCFKNSNLFVFSNNMSDQVKKYLGKHLNLSVVKPGVDIGKFNKSDKESLRLQHNIPSGAFVYVCLGRITAHKAMDKAIYAFSKICIDTNTLLLIVGDGPEKNDLIQLTINLCIQNNVKFYDSTEKPELYYVLADVFLMTSISETFGQTILEAMASNIPVIAFKPNGNDVITASDELIVHNETGLLIKKSEQDLVDAMLRLKTDDIFRMRIKTNMKVEIKRYSWKKLSEELLV